MACLKPAPALPARSGRTGAYGQTFLHMGLVGY